MRKLIFVPLLLCILSAKSQVEKLVYLANGEILRVEYIRQDENTLTFVRMPTKKNDPITINKDEISKTQTLGVRFLDDEYTPLLANGVRKLEFQKLCHTSDYGVHVSCRVINDSLIILMKIKDGQESKNSVHQYIHNGDVISLLLIDGVEIKLNMNDVYVLRGYALYNFAILSPTNQDIFNLINSPIDRIYIGDERCGMSDEYCVMRMLLALLETN